MNKNGFLITVSVVALIVAIVSIFIALGKKNNVQQQQPVNNQQIRIAYVNIDTLLNNYDLYNYLMLQLQQKQQEFQQQLNSKMLSLQRRYNDLQQKYGQHLITTATYQKEGEKLLQEQQKLQDWQQQKALELQDDQANITMRVYDSIVSAVQKFNADKKYDLIFSNNITATGRTLLYGNKGLDITDTIVFILNEMSKNAIYQQDTTNVAK